MCLLSQLLSKVTVISCKSSAVFSIFLSTMLLKDDYVAYRNAEVHGMTSLSSTRWQLSTKVSSPSSSSSSSSSELQSASATVAMVSWRNVLKAVIVCRLVSATRPTQLVWRACEGSRAAALYRRLCQLTLIASLASCYRCASSFLHV